MQMQLWQLLWRLLVLELLFDVFLSIKCLKNTSGSLNVVLEIMLIFSFYVKKWWWWWW